MALKKEINDDRGNTSSYFRVVATIERYNLPEPVITVQLFGYRDANFRQKEIDNPNLQASNSFKEIVLRVNDKLGNARADVYARLKAEVPEFSGAEDV